MWASQRLLEVTPFGVEEYLTFLPIRIAISNFRNAIEVVPRIVRFILKQPFWILESMRRKDPREEGQFWNGGSHHTSNHYILDT